LVSHEDCPSGFVAIRTGLTQAKCRHAWERL